MHIRQPPIVLPGCGTSTQALSTYNKVTEAMGSPLLSSTQDYAEVANALSPNLARKREKAVVLGPRHESSQRVHLPSADLSIEKTLRWWDLLWNGGQDAHRRRGSRVKSGAGLVAR